MELLVTLLVGYVAGGFTTAWVLALLTVARGGDRS